MHSPDLASQPTTGAPPLVLLLAVQSRPGAADRSLRELEQLVQTAGLRPAGRLLQTRERPHANTFVGRGKLAEVRRQAEATGAQMVVVDAELSPRQVASLDRALELEVRDRTEIILEIFAQHAQTREGRLQVARARLEYLLPRLVGRGVEMSQIGGGRMGGGAVGVRGPGITRLEMDRRSLRRRLRRLDQRLEQVRRHRETERAERARSGLPLVGLVGYTNAGKSSLLNALAGEQVAVANDRLFQTLDTTVRRVDLGERVEALVSDTVGFIDKLPTHLISAFRATLEETRQADLLVEVLDAADPAAEAQHRTVEQTLADLRVGDQPRLLALNKWDLVSPPRRAELAETFPQGLPLSALSGEGLGQLQAALRREAVGDLVPLTVHLPYDQLSLLDLPPGRGVLLDTEHGYEHVTARLRVDRSLVDRLRPYVVAEP